MLCQLLLFMLVPKKVFFGPRDSDNEGTTFCRNVCNYTVINTAEYSRRT